MSELCLSTRELMWLHMNACHLYHESSRFFVCRHLGMIDCSPYNVINHGMSRWWRGVDCLHDRHAGLLHLLPCRMHRCTGSKLWCQVYMQLQDESPHPTIIARPMLLMGLATNLQGGGHRLLLVELCQHLMWQTSRCFEITFS